MASQISKTRISCVSTLQALMSTVSVSVTLNKQRMTAAAVTALAHGFNQRSFIWNREQMVPHAHLGSSHSPSSAPWRTSGSDLISPDIAPLQDLAMALMS